MTLNELVAKVGKAGLFNGTDYDEATQDAIIFWYGERQICDDVLFERYFKRLLNAIHDQYINYLRIQTVKIDPLVSDYMERLVKDTTEGTTSGKTTRKGSTVTDGTSNTTNGNTSTTEGTNTGTIKSEGGGTSSETVGETNGGTVKNTGTVKDEASSDGNSTSMVDGENHTTNMNANADIPQSPQNTDGSFPEKLNWQYQSGQSQGKNDATDKRRTTETHQDTNTTTRTDDTTTTTEGQASKTASGETTTDNTTTNDLKNTSKTTVNGTGSKKDDVTVTTDGSDTTEGSTKNTGEHTEQYSGRHEAPQDLLDRCRSYILQTNAFMWLVSQLQECFRGVLDLDY